MIERWGFRLFDGGIQRTRLFALAVLKFCRQLPPTPEAQESASQLRRAANSTDECVDWLVYLKDARIREDAALLQEAQEVASILAKAVQTARRNAEVNVESAKFKVEK